MLLLPKKSLLIQSPGSDLPPSLTRSCADISVSASNPSKPCLPLSTQLEARLEASSVSQQTQKKGPQPWCVPNSPGPLACLTRRHKTLAVDLLHPSAEHEAKQHKLKRLVQSPNSYFMDVKCPGE